MLHPKHFSFPSSKCTNPGRCEAEPDQRERSTGSEEEVHRKWPRGAEPPQLGRHYAASGHRQSFQNRRKCLTGSGDLLDLVQDVCLHVGVGADLLPVPRQAALQGQGRQLLLVGHHEADDVVLVTGNKHKTEAC